MLFKRPIIPATRSWLYCLHQQQRNLARIPTTTTRLVSITSYSTSSHHQQQHGKQQYPIISFIGGGNMAEAIMGGLQASGHPGSHLRFTEPVTERRRQLESKYPTLVGFDENEQAVEGANVVVLAVKPQVLHNVMTTLAPSLTKDSSTLIISIAPGITTSDMVQWLRDATQEKTTTAAIVRCMPNTPALIGEGAVGLYASEAVSDEQRQTAVSIMHAFAKEVSWVTNESMMETVTGISGSGPAYFFLIMEAMQNAAVKAGLIPEVAKALTLQTCLGAARMAQESDDDLATLRRKVTSPKGTTEAAINSLESNHIRKIMEEAVLTAQQRGHEIAEELRQQQE
ncbi:pyrroline-5-carboxylate reductase [Lichtheimia corymbifera JMRC:FSU:9682]|uniref:Pyrroline-5-carboxylate reductase n=1 Tax=Lichtheimia corymbifera JMRC:FSU:9682 TaxID=1263082 RepID=A0A068RPR3_9FUNG|nr:pyrroline-5-carboxylate reductase [Lichtheimia corymbifera JMRC:FSU:9682]